MAKNPDYFPTESKFTERAASWVLVILVVLDVTFFGLIAWNSWRVAQESRTTFAKLLEDQGGVCHNTEAAGVPVRYEQSDWKVSFELPSGYRASSEVVDAEGTVDLRIVRKPDASTAASPNALLSTSVHVRIGPASGFSRYYTKPFTAYDGYRRFTAVGRPSVGWTDPEGAYDAVQVIKVDDTRYDREIGITYAAVEENAETLAQDILKSMRLAAREQQGQVVKPGWKVFTLDPIRFQYPEDYKVTTPFQGRISVQGKGGRIEIQSAYDLNGTGGQGLHSFTTGGDGVPSEFFDIQYGVDLRVSFYYDAAATSYDRSVLKDIGSTISLSK